MLAHAPATRGYSRLLLLLPRSISQQVLRAPERISVKRAPIGSAEAIDDGVADHARDRAFLAQLLQRADASTTFF